MRPTSTALMLAACWLALVAAGATEAVERITVQARYLLRPVRGIAAPVTMVAIDERALRQYGQMPWDRRRFAAILDRLQTAGARVVGMDVAFSEPARDPAEDRALEAALRRMPTVLPTFLAYSDAGRTSLRLVEPQPGLARAAVAMGGVQLSSRPQYEVWEAEPYQDALDRRVPSFPAAVAGAFGGTAWSPPERGFPWQAVPMWIDFAGPTGSVRQISAVDVLEGALGPGALAGRIALVGATATGLPDTNFAVPDLRGGPMAGVEIAAHVVENLLGGGGLRRLHVGALALLMTLLALLVGRPLASGTTPAARRSAWLAGGVAGWAALSLLAFQAGVWLELVPVLGLFASCFVAGLYAERTALLTSRNVLLGRYAADLASEAQRQRSRIEGELHDSLQQLLVVLGREIRQVLRHAAPGETRERVELMRELTESAQTEVKRLRSDLLPPALRYGRLVEALPALLAETGTRSGLETHLEVQAWDTLPSEQEVELYWLVKEALNNVEKHAAASRVTVRLRRDGRTVAIEVVDDGHGFEPPDLSVAPPGIEHSGLHRMWLRMQGQRGDLQVVSAPGAGTTVRLVMTADARRPVS